MRWILIIPLPYFGGIIALYAFLHLFTALLYMGALAVITLVAAHHYDRHHMAAQYDDRLPHQRSAEAIQRWIIEREVEKKC